MSVGGVSQRLRSGAWCRHRPRLALAHARLAGVTAGVDDRDVNPAGLDLAPFARACAGGEMGCRDKPGNDSGRRAQTLSRPLHSSSHGYPAAAATASFSITLTRYARYSAEAWRSLLRASRSEEQTSELKSLMRTAYAVL